MSRKLDSSPLADVVAGGGGGGGGTLSTFLEDDKLSFEEDSHKYTMLNLDGELTDKWPSVSKVMKLFYDEFPAKALLLYQ